MASLFESSRTNWHVSGRPQCSPWLRRAEEHRAERRALRKIQAVCTQSREGERGRGGRLQRRGEGVGGKRWSGGGVGQIENWRAVSVGES